MEELTKRCNACGELKPLKKFKIAWAGFRTRKWNRPGYADENPAKVRRNRCAACDSKSELAKLKLEMLEEFGCKCSCCGETHPDFLTLDHVKDDGAAHRDLVNCQQAMRQARRDKWDRSKWDCLCITCNFAKGHYGGCPHKTGLTPEMALERLRGRNSKIGRMLVNYDKQTWFKQGFDEGRMQRNRRVLKPCPYCGESFGSNEMVRHKREKHVAEMESRRQECLTAGRGNTSIPAHGTPASAAESAPT